MAISPLDISTEGYLNSPLSVAVSGYLYVATVATIDPETGGSTGKTRQVKGRTVAEIQRLLNEDEEIIMIVLAAVKQDLL